MAEKWESSRAKEHIKSCHGQFDWMHLKNLAKLKGLRERKIRDSLEINNLEVKTEFDDTFKVSNRNLGNIVNTNSRKTLILNINL